MYLTQIDLCSGIQGWSDFRILIKGKNYKVNNRKIW